MAGPLIPYASGAIARFGPALQRMLQRNIPIAQQSVQGLLGGSSATAGRASAGRTSDWYGKFRANNPYAPMGATAPLMAGVIGLRRGGNSQAPDPRLSYIARGIGPVGREREALRLNTPPVAPTPPSGRPPIDPVADALGIGVPPPPIDPVADALGIGVPPDMTRPPIDPVADALGIGVPPDSATPSAAQPNPDADVPVPPARPSKGEMEKLKALQRYSNDYQTNSLPVFNEGKINWGTDASGYSNEDNYGGDAADFFRADALRMAVPGLLGM